MRRQSVKLKTSHALEKNHMSAHLQFKEKITKPKFEEKLIEEFGSEGLVRSPYTENGQRLSLFYKDDFHIATHTRGTGWIFTSAYDKFKPLPRE